MLQSQSSKLSNSTASVNSNIEKFKEANSKLREDLKARQAFYNAEAQIRLQYQKTLAQILDVFQDNFKDADFSDCSFEYLMINPVSYPEAVRHILEEEHVRRGIRTDDWDMISDWFRVNSSRGLNEKPNAIINCSISDFMKPSRKNIRFKGGEDTIEYNANAFKTQPNAVVEELLKKLPGVEVENDGTVKAQG